MKVNKDGEIEARPEEFDILDEQSAKQRAGFVQKLKDIPVASDCITGRRIAKLIEEYQE